MEQRIKSSMHSLCKLGLTSSVIIPSKSQSESTAGVVVELALGTVCEDASLASRDLLLLVI